jgi:hypothetical protein
MDASSEGVVVRGPRRWLRLDGLVVLVGALAAFATTDQAWWLVPLLILLPDLSAVGYLGSTRSGAAIYNLGHTYLMPAVVVGLGMGFDSQITVAIGLVWFAHIGMDRAAGFGLKYEDAFKHTHLGWIGQGG